MVNGESAAGGVDRDRSGIVHAGPDLAEKFSVGVVGAHDPVVVDDEQATVSRRMHRCDVRDRDVDE